MSTVAGSVKTRELSGSALLAKGKAWSKASIAQIAASDSDLCLFNWSHQRESNPHHQGTGLV